MAQKKFPSEELWCGSVTEPLPDIHKGPGSIPGTTGEEKKTGAGRMSGLSSVRLSRGQADCTPEPTSEQPCSQNTIFPDMTGSRFECLAGISSKVSLSGMEKPLLSQVRWCKHVILALKRLRQRTRSSRQTGLHETLSQNKIEKQKQTNKYIINKEKKYCCWSSVTPGLARCHNTHLGSQCLNQDCGRRMTLSPRAP